MSHSGVPGVEQVANFVGGGNAPTVQSAPAAPTVSSTTQQAEEEEQRQAAGGAAANILTGQNSTSPGLISRQVLLGS